MSARNVPSDLSGKTLGSAHGIAGPDAAQIRGAQLAVAMQVVAGKLDPAGALEILQMLDLVEVA